MSRYGAMRTRRTLSSRTGSLFTFGCVQPETLISPSLGSLTVFAGTRLSRPGAEVEFWAATLDDGDSMGHTLPLNPGILTVSS